MNKFLNFLSRWKQLERDPLIQKHRSVNKAADYILRFVVVASSLTNFMVLAFIFTNTTSSAVLYNHPELINIFTRPALLVSQSLTTTYMILLVLVNVNILVLVSYQTASIVDALESATKKIFEDLEPPRFRSTEKSSCNQFHEQWSLYEQLRHRVNEANNLLGFLPLPTLCIFYMNNVQLNTLICRPKDLYEVSYSLLLQIFGTIVTYTVIILQSA